MSNETFEPAVSEFVRSLQCVQKLNVPSLDQSALEHISDLTTLTKLVLSSSPEVLTLTRRRRPMFPALRQLTFSCLEIGPTTSILRWCNEVPLVEFFASLWEMATGRQMDSLLAAISAAFLESTLTKLDVECECDDAEGSDPNIHLISFQSFRRLFRFVNLTRLCVTSPLGIDLDDGSVAELARAWPGIVTLSLAVCFPGHAPRATLSCLHVFAQYCPHLSTLTIVIDARVVPSPEADPRTRFVQHTLTTMNVEHSPLADPFSVARFLSGIFPKLVKVQTQREYDHNDEEDEPEEGDAIRIHRRWKKVQRLLPELSALRDEGRMLAQASSTV